MSNRCRHLWQLAGRAPDFGGQRCMRWRCVYCNKERELFEGVVPKDHVVSEDETEDQREVLLRRMIAAAGKTSMSWHTADYEHRSCHIDLPTCMKAVLDEVWPEPGKRWEGSPDDVL